MKKKVIFTSANGKCTGYVYTPKQYTSTLLFLNGIGTTVRTHWYVTDFAEKLCANGYRVLVFDYYGRGESEGRWEETNVTSALSDVEAACNFLKDDKFGLIGESFGGLISLLYASKNLRVKTIALLYGLYDLDGGEMGKRLAEAKEKGFTFSKTHKEKRYPLSLFADAKSYKTLERIPKIKAALLVTHGDQDSVISVSQAQEIYAKANEPKKLIVLKGEEHVYTKAGFQNTFEEILNWFNKYL